MRHDTKLRVILSAGACLLALGIGLVAAQPSRAWLVGGPGSGGGGAFVGAGDVASFTSWWGVSFAYSVATKGTKAVNLCNSGVCADVSSDATTGIVTNAPTINGAPCDNSGHVCLVDIIYDKVGTADMSKAGFSGHWPTWVVSGAATGIPCARYPGTITELDTGTGGSIVSQPYLVSGVVKRDLGQTANQDAAFGTNLLFFYHEHSADNFSLYDGGVNVLAVSLTDNTWGAVNGVYNGASSYLNANGTTNSGSLGTTATNTTQVIGADGTATSANYVGMICEIGLAGAISSTATADALVTNQRNRYGF